MNILSQDKEKVINYDNVNYLGVYRETNYAYISVEFSNPYSDFSIGIYATEERAKEVLLEIFTKMKANGFDFTYEMPAK